MTQRFSFFAPMFRGRPVQFFWVLVAIAAIAVTILPDPAFAQASTPGFSPQLWFRNALAGIDSLGVWGPLAFIGLYLVATVAFLPGSILTLGAGVVFGVVKGALWVFIGAMLGATAAFLVGRYGARQWVARKIANNPKFKALDEAIGREGLKIIFLIRLSPAFPFNLLNYGLGLTQVSLRDYILGSVGILPGTILYVYIGSLAGNLALIGTGNQPSNPAIAWTIRILSFVTVVAVTVMITRIARKALREAVPESSGSAEVSPQ
jgi:uncharacterized membrane protein YdjX (TVP38/TMEM64 family)